MAKPDSSQLESDRVRSTYAAYDESGRERLWDRSNRGFDRLKSDSERLLLALLGRSGAAKATAEVLDVGCGTGDLAALARRNGLASRWTGVDLLEDRIETARAHDPSGTYLVASADALPSRDDAFDVVTAITLFSSIPTERMADDAAKEIGRVLSPGGWLVWYDLRRDNPWNPDVHGVTESRLAQLFPGWHRELRSFTVVPPIARRLGPVTPVAYPLLHAIPALRSHLIGRLQCPR